MGNYKFRLSDMMPNAWFYKLRDMSKAKSQYTIPNKYHTTKPTIAQNFSNSPSNPKSSDTHFPNPPRKSPNRKKSKRKSIHNKPRLITSSVSAACSCRLNSVWTKPAETIPQAEDFVFSSSDNNSNSPDPDSHESPSGEFNSNTMEFGSSESFNGVRRVTSSTTDIFIDMKEKSFSRKFEFDTISELVELPPILTKPIKFQASNLDSSTRMIPRNSSKFQEREAHGSLSIKIVKEGISKTQKETKASPMGGDFPRKGGKKVQIRGRSSSKYRGRRFSEGLVIVKSSFDPQRDFMDSMVEMIAENSIRDSKDLEELLACYLSLNSDEYHDLIVKAFEQIWFDMGDKRM